MHDIMLNIPNVNMALTMELNHIYFKKLFAQCMSYKKIHFKEQVQHQAQNKAGKPNCLA